MLLFYRVVRLLRSIFLLALLLYWAGIFTLTHLLKVPAVGPQVGDKTAHFVSYGLLATLLFGTLWVLRPNLRRLPFIVLGIAMAYGAIDEITQPIFGRGCDFYDWCADATGALLGVLFMTTIRWLLTRQRQREQLTVSTATPLHSTLQNSTT